MNYIQALRQCIEAMKLVDFKDCAESAELWHKFNLAQANAERVLRDGEKQEPLTWLRFRAAQSWSGSGNHDIDYNEWLEECKQGDIGDDQKPAFPVYTNSAPSLQAVGAVPEGWQLVPVDPTDEMRQACRYLAYADHIDEDWAAMLAAAPQPAAAPSGDEAEQLRGEGWLRAMSDVSAILPSTYYMDPPDGGSVTVLEQVERMAKDAERYRWLRNPTQDVALVIDKVADETDGYGRPIYEYRAGEELDSAIDAAMAKEKA